MEVGATLATEESKASPFSDPLPIGSLEYECGETCQDNYRGLFETARTSRLDETSKYLSMAELVRDIREEAQLSSNTPRPVYRIEDEEYYANGNTLLGPPAQSHRSAEELRKEEMAGTGVENTNSADWLISDRRSVRGYLGSIPQDLVYIFSVLYIWCATRVFGLIGKIF